MSSDRWRQFRELFELAVAKPPAGRAAFLAEACAGDETLRQAVESLIAADARASGFLDQPVVEPPRSDLPVLGEIGAAYEPEPPRTVGPYRLLRQVGRGGMSTIHLAEREDASFDRQVVVKLLRHDMQSESIRRRLRTERQILASLDHANIARMFDGGATETGQPYFVLEFIEGLPIDAYCDQQKLSVLERLALFAKVCDAVHYAHQKLIVHRDLKPSNILVTREGEPKLLDFGIAKLLDPDLAPRDTEPTAAWVRLLTPNYASPEQVRGEQITTASDVYSLGVLLYQLLTSDLPYRFPDASPHEIERILAAHDPLRPSAAVARQTAAREPDSAVSADAREDSNERKAWKDASNAATLDSSSAHSSGSAKAPFVPQDEASAEPEDSIPTSGSVLPEGGHRPSDAGQSIEAISHNRNTVPSDLRRVLSGDLDAIVLKALRSDPSHRYGSVEQLGADLDRFVEHRPVTARRGNWQYRSVKFLRRNQKAVAISALVAALFLGFFVSLVAMSVRVVRERDLARSERDKKDSLLQLVVDLFTTADPFETGKAPDMTIREALARSEPLFAHRLQDQPELRAQLLHTTGEIYARIGLFKEAEGRLAEALSLRHATNDDRNLDVLESQRVLADVHKALADFPSAHALATQALSTVRSTVPAGDAKLLPFLNSRVSVHCYEGSWSAATAMAEEALNLARGQADQVAPESLTRAIEHQANLATSAGRHGEAADLYRESLAVRRRVYGAENPFLAVTFNNLGSALRRQGDLDAARDAFEQALSLKRSVLGDRHPTLAVTLNNLGVFHLDLGDNSRAEVLFREALEIMQEVVGDNHPRVFLLAASIDTARIRQGDLDGVEERLRGYLAALRQNPVEDDWIVGFMEGILGEALAALGRYEEAEPMLLQSLARLRAQGKQHRTVAALDRLIQFFEQVGEPDRAAEYATLKSELGG